MDLLEPWRTLVKHLCERDREKRPATAEVAISEAYQAFVNAAVPINDFHLHINENTELIRSGKSVIAAWPLACWAYFNSQTALQMHDVILAAHLGKSVLREADFSPQGFFDKLEASPALKTFDDAEAAFDDCDPVGDVYVALYPTLDPDRRLPCFRRVLRIAIG